MIACLVCGQSAFRALFTATDRLYGTTQREFQIVACESCGLMRLAPRPAPEELPRYYPAQYWYAADTTLAAGLEERYRRLVLGDHLRFVSRALNESGESGPVLDVGCGGGLFPRLLRERGFALDSPRPRFGHGALVGAHRKERTLHLLASYHPSRQNTNTGKLTRPMFDSIFRLARDLLDVELA